MDSKSVRRRSLEAPAAFCRGGLKQGAPRLSLALRPHIFKRYRQHFRMNVADIVRAIVAIVMPLICGVKTNGEKRVG